MKSFPASVEDLTAQWLSGALGRSVRDFEVERFGEGAGVIGMVTRLHLDTDDGPGTVIAKFPSPASANRTVAQTYDMYGREVNFYRTVANRVALRTPECHYAGFDPSTHDFVLLIEDLRGYRNGDQVTGCTAEEARSILAALAEFHASTWGAEGLEQVIVHDNAMQREGMIAGFQHGWPACVERFPDLIPASARDVGERFASNLPGLLNDMCQAPLCLIHGDVRIDNVFFGADEIALVDWQAVCRSAPEHDVAYFVTQSVPRAVRDQESLLTFYHAELSARLARRGVSYSLEASRARYRVAALYLLCYAAVIAGTLDMGNARGQQLATGILGGSLSALDELAAFELLR